MSEIVKTMKLHIHVNETEAKSAEKRFKKSENTFSRYVQICSQRAQNQQNVH